MDQRFSPRLKLKAIRVEHGESQADIAKILNIAEPTYNQKELGKRDFTLEEAIQLAKYYGKSLDEIFLAHRVNTKKLRNKIVQKQPNN